MRTPAPAHKLFFFGCLLLSRLSRIGLRHRLVKKLQPGRLRDAINSQHSHVLLRFVLRFRLCAFNFEFPARHQHPAEILASTLNRAGYAPPVKGVKICGAWDEGLAADWTSPRVLLLVHYAAGASAASAPKIIISQYRPLPAASPQPELARALASNAWVAWSVPIVMSKLPVNFAL